MSTVLPDPVVAEVLPVDELLEQPAAASAAIATAARAGVNFPCFKFVSSRFHDISRLPGSADGHFLARLNGWCGQMRTAR